MSMVFYRFQPQMPDATRGYSLAPTWWNRPPLHPSFCRIPTPLLETSCHGDVVVDGDFSLKLTDSSPLKIGRNAPKGMNHLQTIHFQVQTVSFREVRVENFELKAVFWEWLRRIPIHQSV